MLEAIDALIHPTLDGDPAELNEHGARWRVDQIAAQRNLHHRPITLDDRREAEFTDDEINEMLRQYGMGSLAESGAVK